MKSTKLTFTTRHDNIEFEITYDTYSRNVNIITSIKMYGYALDIYELEEQQPEAWKHFEFAMQNNANTYWGEVAETNPFLDIFESVANICRC